MNLFDKAINYSADKKQLAAQTYNLVDKQIQLLDVELVKLSKEFGTKPEETKEQVEQVKKKVSNKTKVNKSNSEADKNLNMENNETFTQNILNTKSELGVNMDIDPSKSIVYFCLIIVIKLLLRI